MVRRRLLGIGVFVLAASGAGYAALRERGDAPTSEDSAAPVAPTRERDAISREKLRALSPKVVLTPEGARLMLGALPDEHGVVHAEIPELEDALELEDADEARQAQVLADARALIPEGAQLRSLDVACSETLCRMKMIKARGSEADWSVIDTAIAPFATGEKIFLTEAGAETETGYVYFSGDDGVLPLAQMALPEDDEGT